MQRNFGLSLVLIVSATVIDAGANDLYVSASNADPGDGRKYSLVTSDLQAAIDKATTGDTVWVEDGFVCETGSFSSSGSYGPARIGIPKAITVRSVSGDPSSGTIIRGAFHTEETPIGEKALRCVYIGNNSAKLYGFRLEGGATTTTDWGSGYGGGAVGFGTLTNCLITGCRAGNGGGTLDMGGTLYLRDCIVSNNVAGTAGGVYGCSVYGSRIVNNHATADSGGIRGSKCWDTLIAENVSDGANGAGNQYGGSLENCVIRGNEAKNGNVGGVNICNNASIRNCLVADNVSSSGIGGVGLAAGHVMENCVISNNWCKGGLGGGVKGGIVLDCTVVDNLARQGGGGIAEAVATNTVIRGNSVEISYWHGGGVYKSSCDHCEIISNTSPSHAGGVWMESNSLTFCRIIGNRALGIDGINTGNGGGVSGTAASRIESCLIADNFAGRSGGGVSGKASVVCSVISNNVAVLSGGGASDAVLADSTIVGNAATNSAYATAIGAGLYKATATNCLVVGNMAFGIDPAQADGYSRNTVIGSGGGAYESTLVSCVVSNSVSTGRGGALYNCTTYNTIVACNTNLFNSGAGAWAGTHYNTLFTGNVGPQEAGVGAYDSGKSITSSGSAKLYNCTVAGNVATGTETRGGVSGTFAFNTVVCDNVGTGVDEFYFATNSCFSANASVVSGGNNRLFGNGARYASAKLDTVDGKAWTPIGGSPCRNRGETFAWMTDPGDVRSHDVYGAKRISGSAVDIGAVESLDCGFVISFR